MRPSATRCRRVGRSFSLDRTSREFTRTLSYISFKYSNISINMTRSVTALTLATLLALFEIGSCLKCYQCNSQSDPNCKDPFAAKDKLVDCISQDSINYNRMYLRDILPRELVDGVAGAPRYCHKIVMQNGATVRTCLDANPSNLSESCRLLENLKQMPVDPSKQIKSCAVCDKEGCNSAGSIQVSLPLAVMAALISYLYKQ